MEDKKLEEVLQIIDPKRRVFLKRLVAGAAFAVPLVASYSVKDLGAQVIGSPGTTTTSDASTTTALTTTMMTTTTTDPLTTTTITMMTTTMTTAIVVSTTETF